MTIFTVMWYNVLRGFHRKEEDGSSKFEPKRLKAAKKIVSDLNPDILFLGEADFNPECTKFGKVKKIMDYKNIFDYPHVFYTAVTERKGEVILSKYPIKSESFTIELFSHIRSEISIKGKKIFIDMIHPYPKIPEKEKAERITPILDKMEFPSILLGDFNALSPEDVYSVEEVTEGFKPARGEGAKENALDALQGLLIKKVLDKGLIDTYRAKNQDRGDSFPTKKYSPFKEKGPMRLDYIFCSKEFKIIESKCVKNDISDMASDHYPLFVKLEI